MPVAAECDGRQIRVRREGERGTDRTQSAQEGSSSSSACDSCCHLGARTRRISSLAAGTRWRSCRAPVMPLGVPHAAESVACRSSARSRASMRRPRPHSDEGAFVVGVLAI
mgnify:CR=1 FL=1